MLPNTNQTQPTDEYLIRRSLAGDRLSAERLAERYRRMIVAIAYHALGNADDAQDVAQEALVYAHQRLHQVREVGKFSGWLRHVTLSLCVDYRRRRGTRRLGEPLTILNAASEENDYAEHLAIRQAIAHLSENHRTTLLLHYTGGWSLEEVAAMTATSVNTVRSRLMAAKRHLRTTLNPALIPGVFLSKGKPGPFMATNSFVLTHSHTALLETAFPGARILSVQDNPEPWQPFSPRVRLALASDEEKTVDFWGNLDPDRFALFGPSRFELLSVLNRLGIPGPRVLHGPVKTDQGYLTLCEAARGENLSLWALGGTPHRIRLATERAFEGIDLLQGATEGLLADPIGATIPRRTLTDELALISSDTLWNADPWLAEEGKSRTEWLRDPWFASALAKTEAAVKDITTPLVYTDYSFFFPQGYRIQPTDRPTDEPLGWPGDPHYQENPLVECTYLFGHFGDPLLGLAMVWVYDCYPFVHTGFVEQFLWRRGITRREFAPRLALKALQMIARDLPVTRPTEGSNYWDSLHAWANQALNWL